MRIPQAMVSGIPLVLGPGTPERGILPLEWYGPQNVLSKQFPHESFCPRLKAARWISSRYPLLYHPHFKKKVQIGLNRALFWTLFGMGGGLEGGSLEVYDSPLLPGRTQWCSLCRVLLNVSNLQPSAIKYDTPDIIPQ